MSLRVWLPLTKDLRQQGLDNVTVTNNGATYESGGKLGGCYNLINGPINITNLPNPTSISVAFWFKRTANTNTRQFMFTAWSGVTCELTTDGKPTFAVYRNSYPTITGPTAITTSTGWIHYCGTFSPIEGMKMYLNGELVASNTNTTAISWSTTTGQIGKYGSYASMSAQMNDFRLYDHALSQMEIKELAQGLVLHYPLNDKSIESTTNLNTKVNMNNSTNSIWGGHSTTTTTYDCTNEPVPFNSGNKIEIIYPVGDNTGGGTSINLGVSIPVTSSTIYTLSVYLKASDNFSYWSANFIYYYGDSSGHGIFNINNKEYIANGWYRIWGTLTTGSSQTSLNPYFYSYPSENRIYYIGGWQLEQKDHMTPFTSPGTSRDNYMIYDCSGFCNNLNKNGTYSYTSDTPKYAVSTKFNGTEWMNGATPGAEILTLACWAKTSKNKSTSQFMVADSTSQLCISFYSGTIISFFGGSGQSTGSKCTLGSAYKENDWNHFVVVKTGAGTRKVYCNGIEQTATSNDYWGSAAGLFIGSRNNSATLPFYGQICDVRAYVTALSADDIKSLYQNSAYIDSSGNVYGAVHTEV